MLSFENINNKSIIDNNKSYKEPFSKQGKQIISIKENFINNVNTTLIENDKPTSGINDSIKENFESTDKFYFPSLYNINTNINENEDKIENADKLLNSANNLLNDPSMNVVKRTYSTKLDNYTRLKNDFNQNTQNYLNNTHINKNVYVTSYNKDTSFKGVYNDSLISPSMGSIIQTSNFDDCKETAYLTGKKYFGLLDYDINTNKAKCVTSDLLTNTSMFTPKCNKGSDDKWYGGSWANAIYKINSNVSEPNYEGCYNDNQNNPDNIFQRAMYPASWIVNWYSSIVKNNNYTITDFVNNSLEEKCSHQLKSNGVYQPVYFLGKHNSSPWRISFPDNQAQWIWYKQPDGNNNADNNKGNPKLILGIYQSPSSQKDITTANIYCTCDNSYIMKVNNKNKDNNERVMEGTAWNIIDNYTVYLQPGYNIIEVYVVNEGGPAGFIFSMKDNTGKVIFRSYAKINNAPIVTSSDIGGSGIWLYSKDFSTVQDAGTNNYTVTTCAEYARKLGYQYIGLQNKQPDGSAQCFVSNNLIEAQKYGSAIGFTMIDNKTYGIGNVNAVYEFNAANSHYNLIGSVGYVDESNNLFKYPENMISYADTYTTLDGYSSNMDVNNTTKICNGLETCKQTCNSDISCNGFTFDSSPTVDKGYLSNKSNKKVFGYRNKTEELKKTTPNYKLYMRDPKINNHFSCSKIVNSNNNKITATDWANHSNIGNMNNETTCGLYKFNKDIQEQLETAKRELNNNRNELIDKTIDVITTNNDLHSQMIDDETLITNTSTLYDEIDDKYAYMVDNKNLNNILDNSNLVIKQSQYYYIIWIVLILLIIIGVIIILRRI